MLSSGEIGHKPSIIDAVEILYGTRPVSVNTARTVYGKKAFVKFDSAEKARIWQQK